MQVWCLKIALRTEQRVLQMSSRVYLAKISSKNLIGTGLFASSYFHVPVNTLHPLQLALTTF